MPGGLRVPHRHGTASPLRYRALLLGGQPSRNTLPRRLLQQPHPSHEPRRLPRRARGPREPRRRDRPGQVPPGQLCRTRGERALHAVRGRDTPGRRGRDGVQAVRGRRLLQRGGVPARAVPRGPLLVVAQPHVCGGLRALHARRCVRARLVDAPALCRRPLWGDDRADEPRLHGAVRRRLLLRRGQHEQHVAPLPFWAVQP
mmetsp:Transcript_59197/g.155850  ORF Transcript_59197/g.155850 Transcript_59197/m.155850 type:complete len:201 (+) Transcript_59197:855-1457(+)